MDLRRKVDFKNTLIIMTSNIGVRQLKDFGEGVGFATAARQQSTDENNKAVIEKALKRTFSPEFLNRIDDVMIFNSLTQEHIFRIIDILMKGVMKRLMQSLGSHLNLQRKRKPLLPKRDTISNLAHVRYTGLSRNTWKILWQRKY